MSRVATLSVLLASTLCATVVARPATSLPHVDVTTADQAAALPLRRLHAAAQEVRVADFTALPKDLSGVLSVPDVKLGGSVTAAGGSIGPGQAKQLSNVLKAEMAEVPASKSVVTEEVQHPGAEIMGKNTNGQGFPTVWAPFRSGWVFQTADSTAQPGTVLHFSYITLAMPDVTYGGIYASGFMDYVDLGDKGLVCITNSVMVLASCAGYKESTYKMWCCKGDQCNIVYTQEELDSLGIDTGSVLDFIPCYGLDKA